MTESGSNNNNNNHHENGVRWVKIYVPTYEYQHYCLKNIQSIVLQKSDPLFPTVNSIFGFLQDILNVKPLLYLQLLQCLSLPLFSIRIP